MLVECTYLIIRRIRADGYHINVNAIVWLTDYYS